MGKLCYSYSNYLGKVLSCVISSYLMCAETGHSGEALSTADTVEQPSWFVVWLVLLLNWYKKIKLKASTDCLPKFVTLSKMISCWISDVISQFKMKYFRFFSSCWRAVMYSYLYLALSCFKFGMRVWFWQQKDTRENPCIPVQVSKWAPGWLHNTNNFLLILETTVKSFGRNACRVWRGKINK